MKKILALVLCVLTIAALFVGCKPADNTPKGVLQAGYGRVDITPDKQFVINDIISKTLPGKVQSYMCAGKPIIACIDGETQMILDEANCGLYCDSEDSQKLANLFVEMNK